MSVGYSISNFRFTSVYSTLRYPFLLFTVIQMQISFCFYIVFVFFRFLSQYYDTMSVLSMIIQFFRQLFVILSINLRCFSCFFHDIFRIFSFSLCFTAQICYDVME